MSAADGVTLSFVCSLSDLRPRSRARRLGNEGNKDHQPSVIDTTEQPTLCDLTPLMAMTSQLGGLKLDGLSFDELNLDGLKLGGLNFDADDTLQLGDFNNYGTSYGGPVTVDEETQAGWDPFIREASFFDCYWPAVSAVDMSGGCQETDGPFQLFYSPSSD